MKYNNKEIKAYIRNKQIKNYVLNSTNTKELDKLILKLNAGETKIK